MTLSQLLWITSHPQQLRRREQKVSACVEMMRMRIIQATAHSVGESHHEILRRRLRRGEIHRLHRGTYIDPEGAAWESIPLTTRHVARTIAVAGASNTTVVCGISAAALHGFPLLNSRLSGPVTVNRASASPAVAGLRVMRAKLKDSDIVEMHGVRTTTLERTIQDLASLVQGPELLAAADAALRLGANFDRLDEPQHQRRTLRWIKTHATDRSDSYAESWSRYLMIEHGVEFDLQQATILDENGQFLARTDFASRTGVIGEFDGKLKYGKLLRAGEDAADAVAAEKQREARLRAAGWEVTRWMWNDLRHPQQFIRMLESGFDRARALPAPRGHVVIEPLRPPQRPDWSFLEPWPPRI